MGVFVIAAILVLLKMPSIVEVMFLHMVAMSVFCNNEGECCGTGVGLMLSCQPAGSEGGTKELLCANIWYIIRKYTHVFQRISYSNITR
jgi:hypothetical protein